MTSSSSRPVNEKEIPDVPDFPIPRIDWRSTNKTFTMTRKVIAAAFFSYVFYDFEGRYLDRVEVTAMIRIKFYHKRTAIVHELFEIFDDPNSTLTMRLRPIADEPNLYRSWWVKVDSWFDELRRENPEFQARADALRGM